MYKIICAYVLLVFFFNQEATSFLHKFTETEEINITFQKIYRCLVDHKRTMFGLEQNEIFGKKLEKRIYECSNSVEIKKSEQLNNNSAVNDLEWRIRKHMERCSIKDAEKFNQSLITDGKIKPGCINTENSTCLNEREFLVSAARDKMDACIKKSFDVIKPQIINMVDKLSPCILKEPRLEMPSTEEIKNYHNRQNETNYCIFKNDSSY